MASTPGPAMEFLGRIAYEIYQMKPLFPTYAHLLVSAIFPIYTAAHASLARPPSAAPAKKKKKDADITDLQDEEISPTIETLTASDAILFPVLAGATLASLYFILKWLQDPALLNYILGLYFAVIGLWFNVKFIKDGLTIIRSYALPNQYSYKGRLWKLVTYERRFAAVGGQADEYRTSPLPGRLSILFRHHNAVIWALREIVYQRFSFKISIWKLMKIITIIDTCDLVAIAIALPLVYYHTFIDKPWFLTNILGFSFCYGSLQITTPGTSSTGSLLLAALFIYDIYFVFYTPMMVTVATKLDVPIKLLFPRPDGCIKPAGAKLGSKAMNEYLQCLAKKRTMAMLGLGDIVIPGMMLAFALRFDLYLYYRKRSATTTSADNHDNKSVSNKPTYLPATGSWGERFWTTTSLYTPEIQAKRFPKVYFTASTIGYVIGMITTVVVMQVYQHAQPALLYLVPGVLGSLWSVALVKGDLKSLWNYSEIPEELKGGDKKKEKEKNDEQNNQKAVEGQDDSKQIEDSTAESAKPTSDDKESTRDKQADSEVKAKDASTSSEQTHKDKKSEDTKDSDDHLIYFALTLIKPKEHHPNPKQSDDQKQLSPPSPNPASASTSEGSHISVIEHTEATSTTSSTETEEWSSEEVDEASEDAESNAQEQDQSQNESKRASIKASTSRSQRASARIAAAKYMSPYADVPDVVPVPAAKRRKVESRTK